MIPIVGVSHHVSFTRPYGLFDVAAVTIANSMTLFPFIDSICDKLDYIGINYYGQVSTISLNNLSDPVNVIIPFFHFHAGGNIRTWSKARG